MRYALVKNNKIEQIIIADQAFINMIAPEWQHIEHIDTPVEQALGVGIGWGWDGSNFVAPPAPPPAPVPEPPVYSTYIDLGPFYDRFGSAKLAVLTATDPGVKAIIADLNIRKWVDLARPDVASALQYVGTQVPALTTELQTEILTTPVADHENLALRKLYFS